MDASKALAEMNDLEAKVKEAEEKVKRAASQPSAQNTGHFETHSQVIKVLLSTS